MAATGLAGDLEWWRAHRGAADPAAMRELLDRLKGWRAEHDKDRAGQFGFLLMAWDAVFGDQHGQVSAAITELEAALGDPSTTP